MTSESGPKALAVVVARLGSKGLSGKNTRDFLGKPLVETSILQAMSANLISKVIVSSDDRRTLDIASRYALEVVVRPSEIASDDSPVGQAILHSIDSIIPDAEDQLTIVLVEPTSPLRPKGFIDACLQTYWASGADSAVSVGKSASQHPLFSASMTPEGLLSKSDGSLFAYARRQDIPDSFYLDGSFYATRLELLRRSGQMYSGSILGIPVNKWQEIEIDDLDDFVMAESLGVLHRDEL